MACSGRSTPLAREKGAQVLTDRNTAARIPRCASPRQSSPSHMVESSTQDTPRRELAPTANSKLSLGVACAGPPKLSTTCLQTLSIAPSMEILPPHHNSIAMPPPTTRPLSLRTRAYKSRAAVKLLLPVVRGAPCLSFRDWATGSSAARDRSSQTWRPLERISAGT